MSMRTRKAKEVLPKKTVFRARVLIADTSETCLVREHISEHFDRSIDRSVTLSYR